MKHIKRSTCRVNFIERALNQSESVAYLDTHYIVYGPFLTILRNFKEENFIENVMNL